MSTFGEARVGLGVIVRRGNHVLLGKRKNAHGSGEWSFPGGHLEKWESPAACAARELEEETGMRIPESAFVPTTFTDDRFPDIDRHYITLYMVVDFPEDQQVTAMEPHKCDEWLWFPWDDLPSPLFAGLQALKDRGFDPAPV